jgi:hypothetical protein
MTACSTNLKRTDVLEIFKQSVKVLDTSPVKLVILQHTEERLGMIVGGDSRLELVRNRPFVSIAPRELHLFSFESVNECSQLYSCKRNITMIHPNLS